MLCSAIILTVLGCSVGSTETLVTIQPDSELKLQGNLKFTCRISTMVEEKTCSGLQDRQLTKTDPNDPSRFTKIGANFQLGWARVRKYNG